MTTQTSAQEPQAQSTPWIAHYAGSNPYKGWSIRSGKDTIVWLGENISSEDLEAIVLAHNKCFDCDGIVCVMNCSGRMDKQLVAIYQQMTDESDTWADIPKEVFETIKPNRLC